MLSTDTSISQHLNVSTDLEALGSLFKSFYRDFPSGPVVKTARSQNRGHGFDPWSGN